MAGGLGISTTRWAVSARASAHYFQWAENWLDAERDQFALWVPVGLGIGIGIWQIWSAAQLCPVLMLGSALCFFAVAVGLQHRLARLLFSPDLPLRPDLR